MSALLETGPRTTLRSEAVDDAPPPGIDSERARVTSSHVLVALSLLLTWAFAYMVWLSAMEADHAQQEMYGKIRSQIAEGVAPSGAPIAAGAPVAVLSIPAIGLDKSVVVEGARPEQLQQGPGHVQGSVLPGQAGISVLAGRSLTFGAPFARISALPTGTVIEVVTGQGRFTYAVRTVRLKGDPLPESLPEGESRLTLVTAHRGSGAFGALKASETVFVDATLVGETEAVTPGLVSPSDPDTRLMSVGVDTPTLAQLALALQVLIASLAGAAWAWAKWSPAAAWIVGAPCVLAALWLASSLATRLLPGLV